MGFVTSNRFNQLQNKKEELTKLRSFLENYSIKPTLINDFLRSKNSAELKNGCKLSDLVLRPQLNITDLVEAIPALKQKTDLISSRKEEIIEATEVLLKYEGYIEREKLIAEKLQRLEHVALKGRIDYNSILSLSTEARQKTAPAPGAGEFFYQYFSNGLSPGL